MQPRLYLSREQIPGALVTILLALFVVMLPRYSDTAKIWFVLLILGATIYLARNWRQLRHTSRLERVFFAVLIGNFTESNAQIRAHRSLLLRTINQIARECRKIEPASAALVVDVIEQKCEQWNIRLGDLLFGDKLSLRDIGRYVKLRMALRQIRRSLAHS